ncbi:helix-turn-helix domain-containing protein [Thermosynechococcaceae cyanobacterium Okahandja]
MPNLTAQQAEKLTQIGAVLHEKRLELGLSLEELAAKTLVRQSILAAIEQGVLDELPEAVYTQGFIRRFADAMGLDGKTLAATFPTTAEAEPSAAKPTKTRASIGFQLRPIHLYFAYFVVVVAAVVGLAYLLRPQPQSITELQPASPSPSPSPANQAAPEPSPSPEAATAAPALPNDRVEVTLSLSGSSWLEIEADGKVVYTGILDAGTERSWQAKERLIVRTGNAGDVKVSVNNGPAIPMGAVGEVTEKEYVAGEGTASGTTTSVLPDAPLPN